MKIFGNYHLNAKKKTLATLIATGLAAGVLGLSGCDEPQAQQPQTQQPQAADITREELRSLVDRVQYLEDINEINKLQSKYIHYLFTQRFDRIVDEIYAKNHPEVSVEFSDSGVYRGLDSIRELYTAFEATKEIPGFFILHMAVNPYIEISEDGTRAKSHWLSPGASGNQNSSRWIWGPYFVEYVKEDGQWRTLHSNLAPIFRNPYEESWSETDDHGTVRTLSVEPDEPSTYYRSYNEVKKETDIFRNHPDLPEPF